MAPYFISEEHPACNGWATVKEDGDLMGCHDTKQEAIDQALAIAQAEGSTYEGERDTEEQTEKRELPENYRPALAEDVPEGRACGNCMFYNEERVSEDGTKAWCERWDDFVDGSFYCNAWEPGDENRQVNLEPPAYMRAAARRGLELHREGLSGDGVVDRTIREARAMANGSVTADKWVRLRAWIARHLVDLEAPAANPDNEDYPSPGVVAHLLWGSGPTMRGAQRALEYAEGVVARLEEQNEGRARGEAVSKLETRTTTTDLEVRETETGMTFTGYAAVWNSPSEPLPFTERIAPGAFNRSIRSRNDIKMLWNHDTGQILGSTRANTLTVEEDAKGLRVTAQLPNTTTGRDAAELLRRGDIDSMSFGFTVPKGGDEWNADGSERTLKSVRLHEVSLVAYPAYPSTAGTTSVRGLAKLAQRMDVAEDALADALLKIESNEKLTDDESNLLHRVISDLGPEEETKDTADEGLAIIALKKKRLELMEKGY